MGFLSDLWRSLKDFLTGSSIAGPYDPNATGSRLYVGNLSYRVKDEELRAIFAKYGRVKTLHLIRDRVTRRLKGYAFLEMSPEDARKALVLNGIDFLGRKIVVSIANSKQRSGGGSARRHQGGGPSRGGGDRFRRRRSGPRVYGQSEGQGQKDNAPIERLE